MTKLITVERANREISRLQEYVNLVESYKVDSLRTWILKEYAYTNSMNEVVKRAEAERVTDDDGNPIDITFIASVISAKPTDELHKILRFGYKQKIKHIKKI